MQTTTRMGWPYPSENQDPWFDALEQFFYAVDLSAFSLRENSNVVMSGGGTATFDSDTGVVAWSDAISLFLAYTGFNIEVEAGSATLEDAQILYANLTRAPSSNVTVTAVAASRLPMTDNALLLAVRRGPYVYWRNGALLASGTPLSPLAGASGNLVPTDVVASRALVAGDNKALLACNSASPIVLTVNGGVLVPGARVSIVRKGTGTVSVAAGSGGTVIRSEGGLLSTGAQFAFAELLFETSTLVYFVGSRS